MCASYITLFFNISIPNLEYNVWQFLYKPERVHITKYTYKSENIYLPRFTLVPV